MNSILVHSTNTGDVLEVPVYPSHTLSGYSDECACEKWADCYYCGACSPDEWDD